MHTPRSTHHHLPSTHTLSHAHTHTHHSMHGPEHTQTYAQALPCMHTQHSALTSKITRKAEHRQCRSHPLMSAHGVCVMCMHTHIHEHLRARAMHNTPTTSPSTTCTQDDVHSAYTVQTESVRTHIKQHGAHTTIDTRHAAFVHAHTRSQTLTHTYTHSYTHARAHTHACAHTRAHTHPHTCTTTRSLAQACTNACTLTPTCVHAHPHAHTLTNPQCVGPNNQGLRELVS